MEKIIKDATDQVIKRVEYDFSKWWKSDFPTDYAYDSFEELMSFRENELDIIIADWALWFNAAYEVTNGVLCELGLVLNRSHKLLDAIDEYVLEFLRCKAKDFCFVPELNLIVIDSDGKLIEYSWESLKRFVAEMNCQDRGLVPNRNNKVFEAHIVAENARCDITEDDCYTVDELYKKCRFHYAISQLKDFGLSDSQVDEFVDKFINKTIQIPTIHKVIGSKKALCEDYYRLRDLDHDNPGLDLESLFKFIDYFW